MEEVTINITEEVEEITINVFEGGTEQIQSDFEQTDETAVDFIKNKPKIDDTVTEGSENAVKSSGIWAFVTTQIDAVKNWATNLFLKKSDEDKGSVAVEGHEQEYNHNAFLTSVPPIPSDISDLADTQGLIPPHLFFDDTYFSGAGTEVDPKSLRTENLPSGGGGVAPKRVATWVAEDNETNKVIFDYWDNNDPIEMIDGLHLIFIIKYNTLDDNYNDTSNRCYLRWTENHTFQRIENAGTSSDIQSLLGELGEKLTTIEIRVLNKKVFARVVEGINDKAQTVREFRSQQDFTTLTGMYINQRSRITFKAGNTIILYEL